MSKLDSLPTFVQGGGSFNGGGGNSGGGSSGTNGTTIINRNTSIEAIQTTNNNGKLVFTTDGIFAMTISSSQKVGINTSYPVRMLDINDANGQCLRLTFNDIYGRSISYTDLTVKSDGSLSLLPSSGSVYLPFNTLSSGLYIGDTQVTSSALQLNTLDVFSFGIAQADKSLILDDNSNITGINNLSATTLIGTNLYGTINTPYQPNINSIGRLDTLSVVNDIKLQDDNNTILDISTKGTSFVYMNSYNNIITPTSLIINNNLYVNNNNIGIGIINARKALEIKSNTGDCLRLSINSVYSDLLLNSDGSMNIISKNINCTYGYDTNTINYPLSIQSYNNISFNQGLGTGINFKLNGINYSSICVQRDSNMTHNGLLSINMMNNNVFTNNVLTLTSSGILTTAEVYEYSDKRVKKNISTIDNNFLLDKILKIQLKKYNYDKPDQTMDNPKHVKIGVIAQEIKEIIPSIVNISPQNNIQDFHSIKSNELVYYLIGCIQNLNNRIINLENNMKKPDDNITDTKSIIKETIDNSTNTELIIEEPDDDSTNAELNINLDLEKMKYEIESDKKQQFEVKVKKNIKSTRPLRL